MKIQHHCRCLSVMCLMVLGTSTRLRGSEVSAVARLDPEHSGQLLDNLGSKISHLMTKKRGMISSLADKLDGLLATVKGPLLELKGSFLTKSGAFLSDAGYKLLDKANVQYYKAGEYWSSKYAGHQPEDGDYYYYEGGYPSYDYTYDDTTAGAGAAGAAADQTSNSFTQQASINNNNNNNINNNNNNINNGFNNNNNLNNGFTNSAAQGVNTAAAAANLPVNVASLNGNSNSQLGIATNNNINGNVFNPLTANSGQFTSGQSASGQFTSGQAIAGQVNSGSFNNGQWLPTGQSSVVGSAAGYNGAQSDLVNLASNQLTTSGIQAASALFPAQTATAPTTAAHQQLQQLQQLQLARQQVSSSLQLNNGWQGQQQQQQQQGVNGGAVRQQASLRPSLIAWPNQAATNQVQQYSQPQQQQQQQFPQQQYQFALPQQQQKQFPVSNSPQLGYLPPPAQSEQQSPSVAVQFQNTQSPLYVESGPSHLLQQQQQQYRQRPQQFNYAGQGNINQVTTPYDTSISRSSSRVVQHPSPTTFAQQSDVGVLTVDDDSALFPAFLDSDSVVSLTAGGGGGGVAVLAEDSDLTLDQFRSGTYLLDNVELDDDGVITLELVEAGTGTGSSGRRTSSNSASGGSVGGRVVVVGSGGDGNVRDSEDRASRGRAIASENVERSDYPAIEQDEVANKDSHESPESFVQIGNEQGKQLLTLLRAANLADTTSHQGQAQTQVLGRRKPVYWPGIAEST